MDTGISEGELSKVSFFDEEEVEEIAHAEGGSYEASECSSTPADLLGTIAFTEDQTNLMLPTPMQSLSDSGKDEIITELEAKLESLTGKLKEQMDGETLILARRERENEEGGNLVALLRTDLDHVNRERDTVQRTNEHLLKLLSDAVKTYMTIEDDISRKLTRMVSDQSKDRSPGAHLPVGEPASVNENGRNGGLPRDPNVQETSILSNITDEGLELSQRISESIFQGPELDEDGEELVADSGNRVQSSVAQLLGMIDDTTNQLVEAKSVHQELLDTLALRTQESEQATARCQDIEDRLKEEVDAKEYLALELHKAEGLIEGYSSEREILEKQLHELEEKKEELVLDLEMTRNKLCDLESAHDEAASLRDEMQRQQTVMQENVGGEAQALMLEVTRLNEDRRDLQQQLKQLQERYESRIHDLETAGEDMERHYITLFEEKKKEIEDLQLQLDNVEKQLKSSKQFIDEQMAEREQEREESQHEIDRLKEFVQSKEKKEEAENRLQREIEDLKQQLERHNDSHSETLLHKEQLERDLQDKSMTAQDMTSLVTQLEQEIEEKAAVEEQLRQKMKQLSEELVKQQDLCDTLSHNITPSPEPCSHASPEHTAVIAQRIANQQSRVPLEEELEKVKQQEEDLIHEKEALQQQVDQQHNQISALRNQLDEMRHRGDFNDDSQVSSLHEKLTETNEALEEKDSKLSAMMEKVLYQDDLIGQKEQQIRNHKAKIEELHGADFDKLQLENDILRNKLQSLEKERDSDPNTMEALSQNLLEEKNEEIDLLTKQISDLQTEVLVLKAGQEFENMTIELEKLRLAEMERARSTPASFSGDVSLTDADAAQLLNLSTSEKVSIHREIEDSVVTKLELISDLENDVLQLRETLQLKEVEIVDFKKLDLHASAHSEELTMLNELLQEKEGVITEMTEQIDTLHGEVENLTDFQTKLQEDFDTVQGMLEDKQREIEHLSRDDTNKQDSDLQLNYDEEMSVVRKGQREKDNVIGERDEEIYTLNEKLEQQESQIGELQKDIVDRHTELNQRQQEIEDLRLDVVAYENLKARLLERESDIRDKDEEIQILTEKSASLKEHLQIAENLQKKLEEAGLFNPDQRVAQNDMEKKRLREEVAALKQRLESDEKSTVLEESVAHISNLKEERSDDTDRIGSNQNESLLAESEDQLKQMREEMKTAQDESDVQLNMKVNQIAELHQELANVRTQWEMDTKLAEEHQQKIIEKDSLIQDKEVETKILKEEINDLQKDLDAIRQKLDAAESAPSDEIGKELIVLQEELTRTKEQASVIIDLENNLKNTRDQVKMKEEQMRQLEIECENSKQEMLLNISRLEGQVDQMQNGNGNDEWNQLNQLTELTEKLNKSDVKMQELTEQLDQRNNDIKQLQTELWETTSRLNSVTEKLEVSDEKLQQSCSQLSEREKHLECLQEELQLRQQTGDQDITKNIQEMATRLEESKQADLIICEKDAELNDIKQRLKEAVEISEQQLQIVEEKDVEYVQLKMDIQQTINEKDKSNKELKQQLHKAQVDKQNEMLKLQQESDDLKQQLLKVLDNKENEVLQLRQETDKLQKSLIDKDVAFQEMNEDLKEMKQQRDSVTIEKDSEITKLNTEKGAVLEKTKEIAQLQAVIQLYEQKNEMVAGGDTTIHLLRTDLQERDNNIQSLETRLEQSQTHIEQKQNEIIQLKMNMKTKMEDEENNGNMENIQQLKRELHETKSALAQLQYPDRPAPVGTLEGHTDIERKQLEEELVEVYRELDLYKSSSSVPTQDYIRKLMELSEKHQHHLQDVQLQMHEQSRAQLTELQKKQEEEVEKLKHFHQIEVEQKVGDAARELKKHNQTEMNQILSQHQKEIERIRRRAIDTDNIEAEHQGLQLQSEVDVTERLDRQLMDRFSTRPEGLGRDSVDASFADSRLNDISHDSSISDQIKSLLSRMYSDGVQMLTLSELQFLNHHMSPDTVEQDVDFRSLRAAWANEKQGFVSAIQSLKDLLAQTHRMRGLDKAGDVSDWRGELLKAIGFVFAKERDSLLAELRSHVVAHPSEDLTEVQKLEQKIRTQESHQQAALEQTLSADRQSMLAEIRDLRAHTSISRIQHQEERERLSEQLTSIEDQTSKRERHLKRQIQLLEYKLQQEKILQNDVKTSLDVERSRTSELSSRLNREKNMNLDFQTENSSMSMQLTKLKDALEREQSRFVSVTHMWDTLVSALEEEKGKTASLTDTLEVEQDKLRHAEAELQTVRTITIQGQNLESHNMEKMKEDLTKERERRIKAENKVEVERIIIETLREELAIRSESIDSMDADFEPRLSQLKSALDSEKTKVVELSCALEHEKLLYTKLQQSLEGDFHETRSVDGGDIVILDALQAELDSEKSELTRLHSSLQREKTNAADMTAAFDALKRASREELKQERATCHQMKRELDDLQLQQIDLNRRQEHSEEYVNRIKAERNQVQMELKTLKELENERERRRDEERIDDRRKLRKTEQARDDCKLKQHEHELESQRLKQKCIDLEQHITEFRDKEIKLVHELEESKLQSHQPSLNTSLSVAYSPHCESREQREHWQIYRTQLESICQSLQFFVLQLQEQIGKRQRVGVVNADFLPQTEMDCSALQRSLKGLLTEIRQIETPLSLETEGGANLLGTPSVNNINERILDHNAELTFFVSRLSDDKMQLRQTLSKLEEEIWQYRQREEIIQEQQQSSENLSDAHMTERASWAKEQLSLQLSLNAAEREVERLQTDLRIERERRVASAAVMGAAPETDKEKMQRLYGKYLKAESFRKALIYQKKYLLLLLGGFQDCEETTLAVIARMGAHPAMEDVQRQQNRRPIFLFRSAARVIIAVFRMKYLMKKWRRATRVGSPVMSGTVDTQQGYMPNSHSYSPPRIAASPRTGLPLRQPQASYSADYPLYNVDLNNQVSSSYTPSSRSSSRVHHTPPTKDYGNLRHTSPSTVPGARRNIFSSAHSMSTPNRGTSLHQYHQTGSDDATLHDDYIQRLENLQHRLGSLDRGSLPHR